MTTLVTAAQIAQLRRMVAEPTTTIYSDATLTTYIENYALVDEAGNSPRIPDPSDPTVYVANDDWTATYDLNAAAAAIWEEKAASLSADYDFAADGGNFSRSQAYTQAMHQARHYGARRSMKTISLRPEPKQNSLELTEDEE